MAHNDGKPFPLLTAQAIAAMAEDRHPHRFNPKAVRNSKSLGDSTGMNQMGIHLVRIAPGGESTEFHTHMCDEEFVYILSGRGMADIGDERIEVGAGDFMGFAARSLPHTMTNPFEQDLVYLMGGTRKSYDITDYPRAGKRSYKFDGDRDNVEREHIQEMRK
jgi:uncharacterized cupin superfamily protein